MEDVVYLSMSGEFYVISDCRDYSHDSKGAVAAWG